MLATLVFQKKPLAAGFKSGCAGLVISEMNIEMY